MSRPPNFDHDQNPDKANVDRIRLRDLFGMFPHGRRKEPQKLGREHKNIRFWGNIRRRFGRKFFW